MSEVPTQVSTGPPSQRTRGYSLMWWAIVLLFPVLVAVVFGAIDAGYGCNIDNDATVLELMGVAFIVLPMAAATFGFLAGHETWRSRGRVGRGVGAVSGVLLSLAWGGVAFWTTLLMITDATC